AAGPRSRGRASSRGGVLCERRSRVEQEDLLGPEELAVDEAPCRCTSSVRLVALWSPRDPITTNRDRNKSTTKGQVKALSPSIRPGHRGFLRGLIIRRSMVRVHPAPLDSSAFGGHEVRGKALIPLPGHERGNRYAPSSRLPAERRVA